MPFAIQNSKSEIKNAILQTITISFKNAFIIACLWEYYVAYIPYFPDKTTFIPLPIDYSNITSRVRTEPEKVNFFIGIQSARSDIKGTDIMYPVLKEIQKNTRTNVVSQKRSMLRTRFIKN